jgi:hypothetical protein
MFLKHMFNPDTPESSALSLARSAVLISLALCALAAFIFVG